jgi:hypothetical protein
VGLAARHQRRAADREAEEKARAIIVVFMGNLLFGWLSVPGILPRACRVMIAPKAD